VTFAILNGIARQGCWRESPWEKGLFGDGEIKAAPDIGTYMVGKTGKIRTARIAGVWRLLSITA
jgi:hypothetical protein